MAYNNLSRLIPGSPSGYNAALIRGRYKIVTGHQGGSGFWTGQVHPNSSGLVDPKRNSSACGAFSCCDGCLYDVQSDPTEHINLRYTMPDIYSTMYQRLSTLARSTYQTSYIQPGIKCLTPQQAKAFYKGFRGPPCFNASAFPVVPPTPSPLQSSFQLRSPDQTWCLSGKKLELTRCMGTAPHQTTLWTVGDRESGELQYVGGVVSSPLCIKMDETPGWNCANSDPNRTAVRTGHCSAGVGSGAHKSNYFYIFTAEPNQTKSNVMIRSNDCPQLCLSRINQVVVDAERNPHAPGYVVSMVVGLTSCAVRTSSVLWTQHDME